MKHGLYSNLKKYRLGRRIAAYRNNPDLMDGRVQLAVLSALLENYLEEIAAGGPNAEETERAAKLAERLSKAQARLHRLEHGTKHTVTVQDVKMIVQRVVHVVRTETDPQTARRVGQRLLQETEAGNGPDTHVGTVHES